MTTLSFGILGAARIAPKALTVPVSGIESAEVTVVAARDRSRAEAFAADNNVGRVADSYQALIDSDDVDVVYNPLPMNLHAEWTLAALAAGKPVLCEKPFASNAAEATEMVEAAEVADLALGEAFHYWYHPLFQRVLGLVADGVIGEVTHLDARFNIAIAQPDLRWDYATSGGSLMDLGCYCLHWVRSVTGQEPEVVSADATAGPPNIDAAMTAELRFPTGVTAHIESSMVEPEDQIQLLIEGTEGRIDVVNPLAPQNGNRLLVQHNGGQTVGSVDAGVTYSHMVRAFCDHVVLGTPFPTAGADSVANMAAIDAIYQAAGLPIRGT